MRYLGMIVILAFLVIGLCLAAGNIMSHAVVNGDGSASYTITLTPEEQADFLELDYGYVIGVSPEVTRAKVPEEFIRDIILIAIVNDQANKAYDQDRQIGLLWRNDEIIIQEKNGDPYIWNTEVNRIPIPLVLPD